jgi:hypothetical protein
MLIEAESRRNRAHCHRHFMRVYKETEALGRAGKLWKKGADESPPRARRKGAGK